MYSLTDLYNDLVSLIPAGDIKAGVTYLGVEGEYSLVGSAVDISNNTDYVDVGGSSYFLSNQLTISAWVKPDYPVVNLSGQTIIAKWKDWETREFKLVLNSCEDNHFGPQFIINFATHTETECIVAAGEWTHILVLKDASAIKIYVNGVLQSSFSTTENITQGPNDLFIGAQQIGDNRYFDGLIDEVNIWNRALSQSEITQLYAGGYGLYGNISTAPFNNGLLAGYHFDNNLNDFSGNGFNGVSSADYYAGIVPLP